MRKRDRFNLQQVRNLIVKPIMSTRRQPLAKLFYFTCKSYQVSRPILSYETETTCVRDRDYEGSRPRPQKPVSRSTALIGTGFHAGFIAVLYWALLRAFKFDKLY